MTNIFKKKDKKDQSAKLAQTPKPGKFGAAKYAKTDSEMPTEQQESPIQRGVPNQVPGNKEAFSRLRYRIEKIASKKEELDMALRENNIKQSPYEFIKRMLIASIFVGIVMGIAIALLFWKSLGFSFIISALLGAVLSFVIARLSFANFLNFPFMKGRRAAKEVDKGILFAARDMIISLRSGMPLFNAITSVSVGYGEASKEFAKIVERVQLGKPLEQAIDDAIAKTKSQAFKRLMLQASVSIKAGSEVVSALQTILDQLAQERVIELRRYGQKLNAVAMFYMLFGIILPSMGIAVITILTTFISIFSVTTAVLAAALVFLIFMQVVFLKLSGSRPVFSM